MPYQIQTNINREGPMTREELEKDRDQIVAQMQQLQGMLTYVQQKLAALDKLKKESEVRVPEDQEA